MVKGLPTEEQPIVAIICSRLRRLRRCGVAAGQGPVGLSDRLGFVELEGFFTQKMRADTCME
jgi:hypothetical protein